MVTVCVKPFGTHSRAMVRVEKALGRYAPSHVEIVEDPTRADIQVAHVVGADSLLHVDTQRPYAVIQYCWKTCGMLPAELEPLWQHAKLVWSYYDLRTTRAVPRFYYAPLGVDQVFVDQKPEPAVRDIGIVTTGYVSAADAEAISEVAIAADLAGLRTVHIGPEEVEGMNVKPETWSSMFDISDEALADVYRNAMWVSGLRQKEGFELPVLEGLMCGARPIVFDHPEMITWFDGYATMLDAAHGDELIARLVKVFTGGQDEVHPDEKRQVARTFNWETIATGFWKRLL